jgi:GNAT superfamily N-acetyltransferase
MEPCAQGLGSAGAQWYVFGTLDGEHVGRCELVERVILVKGEPLAVGGVTGVVSEPDYRCRGVARGIIARGVEFMRDERRLAFALLTCNRKLGPLYEKLGWKSVLGPNVYAQPDGPRTCPGLTMVFESAAEPWPEGPMDMQGLPW